MTRLQTDFHTTRNLGSVSRFCNAQLRDNASHIAEPAQLLVRWHVFSARHIDPKISEIFLTQKCDSDSAEASRSVDMSCGEARLSRNGGAIRVLDLPVARDPTSLKGCLEVVRC